MIITRAPLRISFGGGGTDLPAFYQREYGAVFSTAIDKYLYVTVKPHGALFNENYRLNYSETEHVDRLDDIRNEICRECLRLIDVEPPIYISTVADLPAFSGLGSSSSFAVALLNALHVFKGERVSAQQLVEEAAYVEIDVLKRPIGKQDHYAAGYGGLNLFRFLPDGAVTVEPQRPPNGALDDLFAHLMLFWTALRRDAATVLSEQRDNTKQRMDELRAMRQHAMDFKALMAEGFDAAGFSAILDETWNLKRQLAGGISNNQIDHWYEKARRAGALGGKLCGAGGGGFLLFVVPPELQNSVRAALAGLNEVQIGYEVHGSRLLFPFTG